MEAVHRAEEGLERYWVNYEKSIIGISHFIEVTTCTIPGCLPRS